jgi:hypothetical protein
MPGCPTRKGGELHSTIEDIEGLSGSGIFVGRFVGLK